MKEGLYDENDQLIYYKNDIPYHAGVVKVDGKIYYISSHGMAVKGPHVVHRAMAHGILERGVYTFGDDYALVEGSYVPPKRYSRMKRKLRRAVKKLAPINNGRRSGRNRTKFTKKQLASIIAAVAVLVCVVVLISFMDIPDTSLSSMPAAVNPTVSADYYVQSFDGEVLLCTEAALELYKNNITVEQAVNTGYPYRPLYFNYDFPEASGTLRLSLNEDMSGAMEYVLDAAQNSLEIHNLRTGAKYYYRIDVNGEAFTGSFETARSTRFIYITGVDNVRDIGGYVNLDGKTVRQGMIIRGREVDGLVESGYFMDSECIDDIQRDLGIAYEFDLRGAGIYTGEYHSRFGNDVGHDFYGAPQYGQIFSEGYRESLRCIFAGLADEQHYPMYLHCTYGADRTGTIVFLLQGVLNMSEADMLREYRMTGFAAPSYADGQLEMIINGLKPYAGDTLQEKIVSFLIEEIGVTQTEIESIRNILLTD